MSTGYYNHTTTEPSDRQCEWVGCEEYATCPHYCTTHHLKFCERYGCAAQQADTSEQHESQWSIDQDTLPRGLARLDAHGLAELRAIVLRVIDDGNAGGLEWKFYKRPLRQITEAFADSQRLDFCDAIQAAIVAARCASYNEWREAMSRLSKSMKKAPDWFGCGRTLTKESWDRFIAAQDAYWRNQCQQMPPHDFCGCVCHRTGEVCAPATQAKGERQSSDA